MIRSIFENLNSLAESVLVDDEQVISLAVARLLRVDDISPHLYILFLQIFQNSVHHHHQILGGLTLQARSFLSPKPPMLNLFVPGTSLTEESKEPLLKILPLIREAPYTTRGLKTYLHKKEKRVA